MTTPLEDRLRSHYQERTAREPLPGPDEDEALAHTLDEATRRTRRARWLRSDRPRLLLAAAAAVVLLLVGVAAFVTTRGDDGDNVVTDRGPDRSTTTDRDDDRTETTSTTSSTTSTSTPSSSTPPGTDSAPAPTDLSVVVGVDGVLGWWDGSTWVQADANSQIPLEGGEEHQVLRLGDAPQTRTGQLAEVECLEGGGTRLVDVGLVDPASASDPMPIAVTRVADPQPRPVTAVDPGNASYRESALQILAGLGIDDTEPEIAQAVSADLDGNGADEVLVTAERISDPDGVIGLQGDYSVTFLRHVVGGAVETTVVAQSIAPEDPNATPYVQRFRVGTAADLNGDGRMELALGYHHYEGRGMVVYEVAADGTTTEVLTGGCGA